MYNFKDFEDERGFCPVCHTPIKPHTYCPCDPSVHFKCCTDPDCKFHNENESEIVTYNMERLSEITSFTNKGVCKFCGMQSNICEFCYACSECCDCASRFDD